MDLVDLSRRVEWCRRNEALPYIMRDQACWEHDTKEFTTDYAAYCNQAGLFKKLTFEEFLEKREISAARKARDLETYEYMRRWTY
jgi:glutaminase